MQPNRKGSGTTRAQRGDSWALTRPPGPAAQVRALCRGHFPSVLTAGVDVDNARKARNTETRLGLKAWGLAGRNGKTKGR